MIYKQLHPFHDRLQETTKLLREKPDYIPIVLTNKKNLIESIKKLLLKKSLTIFELIKCLHNIIIFDKTTSINLFVCYVINNKEFNVLLADKNLSLEDVYNRYKDEDGYLYLKYADLAAFG